MEKKVLTLQDLYQKNPVKPIIALSLLFIGAFLFSCINNGYSQDALSTLIIMLLFVVPLGFLGVIQKQKIQKGEFSIYLDYVVNKNTRRTGTRDHRRTRYELFFNKLSKNNRNLINSFAVDSKTYRKVNVGDWCYIVKMEAGSISSSQIFLASEYELSDELKRMVKR